MLAYKTEGKNNEERGKTRRKEKESRRKNKEGKWDACVGALAN